MVFPIIKLQNFKQTKCFGSLSILKKLNSWYPSYQLHRKIIRGWIVANLNREVVYAFMTNFAHRFHNCRPNFRVGDSASLLRPPVMRWDHITYRFP